MHHINNHLSVSLNLLHRLVDHRNPVECLLSRGDIVSSGGENHHRIIKLFQIRQVPLLQLKFASGQTISNKKIVHNGVNLMGCQQKKTAPPLLKIQKALLLGVHF